MAVPRPPQETQQAQPRAESLSSEEQEVRDHLRGVLGLDEGEKLFRRLLEDARRNGGSVKSSLEGVEAWMRAQQAFEESKPLPGQPYFVLHQGGSHGACFVH
jgi:hypothetical protein